MNEGKMSFNDIVGTDKNVYTEQDKDWGTGFENPYADAKIEDYMVDPYNFKEEEPIVEGSPLDFMPTNEPEPAPEPKVETVAENIETAIAENKPQEVENIIESNPVEAEKVIDDNSPLNEEAEQILDKSTPQNDEVNNEVVEEAIEESNKGNSPINAGSSFLNNWDNIKVYQPGEDSYGAVDPYDENTPDYVPSEEKPDLGGKDEDFLGPDEYLDENGNIQVDPNWKPENADEDFLGPDEVEYNGEIHQIDTSSADELAASSDLTDATLPTEEPQVEDIPDEVFSDMEELGVASLDEVEGAPVETKEQAKAKQRLLRLKKSIPQATFHSNNEIAKPTKEERLSQAGFGSSALSIPSAPSGGVHNSSMGSISNKDSGTTPTRVKTGGGTAPVVSEDNGSVSVKPSTAHFSNGSMSSGSFGLMSKNRPGDIKVEKMELASGETYSDPSTNIINQMMEGSDLKDILDTDNEIENFKKALLNELSKYKKERSKKWNG